MHSDYQETAIEVLSISVRLKHTEYCSTRPTQLIPSFSQVCKLPFTCIHPYMPSMQCPTGKTDKANGNRHRPCLVAANLAGDSRERRYTDIPDNIKALFTISFPSLTSLYRIL